MAFAFALNPCSTLTLTNFSYLKDFWISCTRSWIMRLRFRLCMLVRRSFILRSTSHEMCYSCSLFWEQSQVEVRKKKKSETIRIFSRYLQIFYFINYYCTTHVFMNFMHFYSLKLSTPATQEAVIAWSNSCLSAVYTVNTNLKIRTTSLTSTISGTWKSLIIMTSSLSSIAQKFLQLILHVNC